MLTRAKKIGELVARSMLNPAVVIALPHDVRAALADLGEELIEINQRLAKLEEVNRGELWQNLNTDT